MVHNSFLVNLEQKYRNRSRLEKNYCKKFTASASFDGSQCKQRFSVDQHVNKCSHERPVECIVDVRLAWAPFDDEPVEVVRHCSDAAVAHRIRTSYKYKYKYTYK